MKIYPSGKIRSQKGTALVVVLVLGGAAVLGVVAMLGWTNTSASLTARTQEYTRALAAAEGAVEKVIAHVGNDYQNYGIEMVNANLASYRNLVPTSDESASWQGFEFRTDGGVVGQLDVDWLPLTTNTVLSTKYTGLRGQAYDLRIVANARSQAGRHTITARNRQIIELAGVSLFQYAVFFDEILEIEPGPPMTINGPVHCNQTIYIAPGNTLTFQNEVTASQQILNGRAPGDSRGAAGGSSSFGSHKTEELPSLKLPIGTVNDPANVSSILLDPSPSLEDPNSVAGRMRLYNSADLVIIMHNSGTMSVTSGRANSFATAIPSGQYNQFINTTRSFYNGREGKTVRAIEVDVDKLRSWSATNTLLRPSLPFGDVRTVYVADLRTHTSGNQSGVRLVNGQWLPARGLTLVTPNPLYVKGHYNVTTNGTPVNLGTHNTSATVPAALIGDAVTILSGDWNDANSTSGLGSRKAVATTVNAAIMGGNVPTTSTSYSGGLENFPRFLEKWNNVVFTYNGSMVCVFRSRVATAPWNAAPGGPYYDAPNRDWAFDLNFNNLAKLPPSTPMARVMIRGSWGG